MQNGRITDSPQSNGVAERKNRTLTDLVNAMLDTSCLSKAWWGERPPSQGAPLPPGPLGGPPVPIFYYMKSFTLEKNHKQAFGMKLRRHEAETWRNQSRAPAKLFYWGNISPRGGNHHHHHHHRSSH